MATLTTRPRTWVVPTWLAAAAVGLGAGLLAARGDWRLACVLGIAGACAGLTLRVDALPASRAVQDVPPPWLVTLLPIAWVATTLLPTLRLFGGAYRGVDAAASGNASLDNLVQLAAAAGVVGLVLYVLHLGPRITLPPTVLLWLCYPALAVLSITWSRLPVYTVGRALEFTAMGGLVVLLTWGVRATEPRVARDLLHAATRLYTLVVLLLVAWMYTTPNHRDGRLEWPGGHPNISGEVIAVAVLLLFAAPRRRLVRAVPVANWMVGVVLLGVQLQVNSRGSAFAMIAGLAAMQGARALRNSRFGAIVVALGVVGGAIIALVAWDQVVDFVLRDQATDRVLGANGRRELWNEILAHPLGNEVWGVGMGAARDLIPAGWAGDAHSAWIDILLSLGVIGLGVVVGALVVLAVRALRWGSPVTLGLVAFAAVLGTNTTSFHEPGIAMGALVISLAYLYVGDPTSTVVGRPAGRA